VGYALGMLPWTKASALGLPDGAAICQPARSSNVSFRPRIPGSTSVCRRSLSSREDRSDPSQTMIPKTEKWKAGGSTPPLTTSVTSQNASLTISAAPVC
jgi:hypothetical protein